MIFNHQYSKLNYSYAIVFNAAIIVLFVFEKIVQIQ